MRVLIIEDEAYAAKNLLRKINQLRPDWEIMEVCGSVQQSLERLQTPPLPELIFSDIELSDGLSFSIFQEIGLIVPIIFTTAYSKYALEAFQHAGMAYLLKPIDSDELAQQLIKVEQLRTTTGAPDVLEQLTNILNQQRSNYRERLLVKKGEKLYPLACNEVALFYTDELSWALDLQGKKHPLDQSLQVLEELLDPTQFFRINRGAIVQRKAVIHASQYFNGRLKLQIEAPFSDPLIVSRERTKAFKRWLEA